jgi:lysine 2,3-aminomutase
MLSGNAAPQSRSTRERLFPGVSDADWNDWRWQYRHRIRDIETLARLLPIPASEYRHLSLLGPRLHLGIPPYYLSLVDPDDPEDPIRRQAVPTSQEFVQSDPGLRDPLAEEPHMVVEGLVHKYPDRALFIATNMCPMYCRHCTRRREWDLGERPRSRAELDRMIAAVAARPQIRDVIFSGGDPLSLPLPVLDYCLSELRKIPHVEIVRIGTRYPVVLPQRITEELTALLSRHRPLWVHTHFNHPREITAESAEACLRLQKAGIPLNNQSVLLRGVNDSAETMMALCHGLLRIGVRPYYLFQCDPVQGAEHLRTSVWTGVEILEKMRGHTSGFAVPTFVVDTEGGGKVPLAPNYLLSCTEDELVLRNYEGRIFRYRNPAPPPPRRSRRSPSLPFEEGERRRKPRLVKGGRTGDHAPRTDL